MIDGVRRKIAACSDCPDLVDDKGARRRFSRHGSSASRWMIAGEAPGKRSVDNGRPWSSAPYLVRRTR